jgi:hypothetical protein
MSLDDKRAAMLEIFHESRDVFVLKDIEKLSVKKGIIQQAVKEVLQVHPLQVLFILRIHEYSTCCSAVARYYEEHVS